MSICSASAQIFDVLDTAEAFGFIHVFFKTSGDLGCGVIFHVSKPRISGIVINDEKVAREGRTGCSLAAVAVW